MFVDSLPKRPDKLTSKGYEREEGEFDQWSASVKKVRFRKRIDPPLGKLVFDIVIEYELCVSDDPDATWEQNCEYTFEEVWLVVWQRIEDADIEDENSDVHKTMRLQETGTHKLRPLTLRMLEQFAVVLGYEQKPPTPSSPK